MSTRDLSNIRVIELGGGIAAPMAGKIFSALGAQVVKIEPPGGDPARRMGPFPAGREDAGDGPEPPMEEPPPSTEEPPPSGDGGTFLYLNAGKRSLTLELTGPGGRQRLRELAGRADLVINGLPPSQRTALGADHETLTSGNPALVMLSITPFGLSGPYRDFAANDLTLTHGGGWGFLCPGKSAPRELPPIKPFGSHALIQAGLHGAAVALASLHGAGAKGEHIDLSTQQVVAFLLGRHFACYPYAGRIDSRLTPPPYEPMSFFPCRDGHIFLICPEEDQYARLLELMGNPAWSREPRMAGREGRERNSPEIKARLSEWTAQWEAEALFHACQKVRVGAAPVYDYPGLERSEHLQAREFFVNQQHPGSRETGSALNALKVPGAPFHLKYPMWDSSRSAPRLGEANGEGETLFAPRERAARPTVGEPVHSIQPVGAPSNGRPAGPLSGIRVLDLSWVWAGPQCTWMLAALGAEVIKVENSRRVDLTRRTHTFASGMEPTLNRNGFFNQINQGKESIALNLSHPEGKETALALAARSDVVISNFGHGVLEKLGLSPEALQAENPELTVVMISACGQTGPARAYLGYGPLISPLAGLSAQTGYGDGEPRDVGIAYGDPNAAVYAAVAIAAALLAGKTGGDTNGKDGLKGGASKSGGLKGQVIDISMWEAMLCTAFEGWINHAMGNAPFQPMGNRHPHLAPHNVYACAGEDAWVALAAETEAQWQALCGAIGRPALAADPRFSDAPSRKANEDALDRIVGDWCAGLERWEAVRRLQAVGVPAMPSLSSKDLAEDPHLLAREAFTHAPHAEVGPRPLMGMPWKMLRPGNGARNSAGHGAEHGAEGSTERSSEKNTLKAAPCLGVDTEAVLQRLLGLDAAAISSLRERGVIE